VGYPSVYAYYIYPQTQSTSMILYQDYGYTYGSAPSYFNGSDYHHITASELEQYPQIRELLEHFKNGSSNYDLSASYSHSSIRCYILEPDYQCYGVVPLKVSEVGKIRGMFEIEKYLNGIEYSGYHYRADLPDAGLKDVYNRLLLYAIVVSVVGSMAIWLWVARVEGRRNRQEDEEKIA
jgi:hypothetical protein